ncbi:lysophospholipid acyltransferase family protein [Candidatus Chlamydia sanziniae]|uniref:SnGlycerol-3-P acyltransferase n=1 Tax=Candidatus Chlamydia sanziniae TaxID=1806891 RepID=A0A1A9HUQ3_9CHLA|nr:lysophospholipid acyltransferase family protein [Candidatus Chlamydia sanziniae]ANH78719.1 SnGlycerol-3-P acyltransferase [Candidatus Chlamydia sanziniae]
MIKGLWQTTYKRICAFLISTLLKLRYRLRVEGMQALHLNPKQGCLFLSNHMAKIDPVILEVLFWNNFHLRPLAGDYLFDDPIIRWFLHIVQAIPVPQIIPGKNTDETLERVDRYYKNVVSVLNTGGSVLLYPSGRLSKTGKENILNQNSAYTLLHKAKQCNVVLVRISGLWGSAFSCYKKKTSPALVRVYKESLFALLRCGLFFMPKRFVKITVCQVDHSFLQQFPAKQDLNAFLSSWFNQDQEDFPIEVPYTINKS